VREHDWCRKRHPCNAPPVTVQPRSEDANLSTTVIPYLQLLHFGDQESASDEVITEHELKERERARQLEVADEERKSKSKKEKTMKCIKVRKLSGCVLS
jgi:hypothetical protein